MMSPEDFVTTGMARIRAAIVAAPSHEEIFAGFEAMLKHLAPPDPEAMQAAQLQAQTEMNEASARHFDAAPDASEVQGAPANDPNPPNDAA